MNIAIIMNVNIAESTPREVDSEGKIYAQISLVPE